MTTHIETSYFVPETLKTQSVWCLWRIEEKDGRKTKVPYSALYKGRASSTNKNTWCDFKTALKRFQDNEPFYNGLGIMIAQPYIFIDIDHAITEEGFDDRAVEIIGAFHNPQYMEVSQSGEGIHIITIGTIPKSFNNRKNNVEMYSQGHFCAFTGNALWTAEPTEEQSAVDYVYSRFKKPDKTVNIHKVPSLKPSRDDQQIIDKAMQRDKKFPLLYGGDWKTAGYNSHSEADCALCMILAFWTDADSESIDRIFKTSGLYREKWERQDYKNNTIQNAIGNISETLSEFIERKSREGAAEFEQCLKRRKERFSLTA